MEQSADGVVYRVQASLGLISFLESVHLISPVSPGATATDLQAGLPELSAGWEYRSFRSGPQVSFRLAGFMRALISEPVP